SGCLSPPMSWDVVILKFNSPRPDITEIWYEVLHLAVSMGETETVRAKITSSLPDVDWSLPDWGVLRANGCSIEFDYGARGGPMIDYFVLHVHGSGDPFLTICKMCRENEWYALDCSTGDFIDLEQPSRSGWQGFKGYRDKVIGQPSGEKPQ